MKWESYAYKAIYNVEKNPNRLKKLIAITFTNRAAEEIKERIDELGIDTERIWVGTIHQFCLDWILKRYRMYLDSLNCGFTIIDERVKERYITEIVDKLGLRIYWKDVNTSYDRNFKLIEQDEDKKKIAKIYNYNLSKRNELDFQLILAISYKLIKMNTFIASDIKDAIDLICIDEYQDTNDLQYAIIEEIANSNDRNELRINFFGDPNQAIYGGLGGIAKDLETLNSEFNNIVFEEKTLSGCYRSTKRIITFYREFMISKYSIEAKGNIKDIDGVISYNYEIDKNEIYDFIAEIIKKNIQEGIPENEICVLAPIWDLLYPFSRELQDRLPNVRFDAPDITPIKRDPLNIFYKIARLLLTESSIGKIWYRKKLASEILVELEQYMGKQLSIEDMDLLNIIIQARSDKQKGSEFVKVGIDCVLQKLQCELSIYPILRKIYDDFFEKMNSRLNNNRYRLIDNMQTFRKMFMEKEGVVINTCHGVKGEEYRTVIAFGLVYGKIPSIYTEPEKMNEEAMKLLYVIASRAKSRLYLFSERGRTYWDQGLRSNAEAFPTRQLFENRSVVFDKN